MYKSRDLYRINDTIFYVDNLIIEPKKVQQAGGNRMTSFITPFY